MNDVTFNEGISVTVGGEDYDLIVSGTLYRSGEVSLDTCEINLHSGNSAENPTIWAIACRCNDMIVAIGEALPSFSELAEKRKAYLYRE